MNTGGHYDSGVCHCSSSSLPPQNVLCSFALQLLTASKEKKNFVFPIE